MESPEKKRMIERRVINGFPKLGSVEARRVKQCRRDPKELNHNICSMKSLQMARWLRPRFSQIIQKIIIQLSNKIIPTELFDTGLSLRENINNIQIISTSTKKIEN